MVGVSPDRVMLLRADMPGGRSVGSGSLVGPSLVLTAAHVVFDDDGHPADQLEVGGINAPQVAARVIWPTSYAAADKSGQLDAALVQITEPSWAPPRLAPVRWARLTGRQPGVACEATGFPRALVDPDGVRDSDQVSAQINPGSRHVAGRYDLKVTSAVPKQLHHEPSLWAGFSGAGVFANGLLVAVVIVDERGGYSGDRLSAVPVYRLASDAEFTDLVRAAGAGLSGPAQLESVELDGILTPPHLRAPRRGNDPSRSPAMLLRPEMGVVPFHGRTELTAALITWCQDTEIEVGVRMLTGPGGQGKTRTANHLAQHLLGLPPSTDDGSRWVCGFLNADADERDLAVLADTDAPLLILVDYAETRSDQLRRLLPLLWDADTGHPVRVLLLARATGDWWTALARDLDGEPGEVIALGTLDQVQDRAAQFAAAVAAFDQRLEDSAPGDARRAPLFVRPPPDLGHDRYGTPLTLQLAALTALLETRHPLAASAAASGAQAEDTLLRHEERYWKTTAHNAGLELAAPILRYLVATATLRGAGLFEDATSALASAVPGTSDLTQDQLHRLDRWLEGLYPPDPGQRWGSLQPDRLGEYLIATTLPEVPGLLSALLAPTDAGSSAGKSVPAADTSSAARKAIEWLRNRLSAPSRPTTSATRHHRALTILARALGNPALTEPAAVALLTQVRDSLAGDLVRLGPVALQVITETAYPGRILAALRAATEKADQAVLAQLIDALPPSSLSLADMAAEWTWRRVAYLRGRVGGTAANKVPWWRVQLRPDRSATLAISLLELANWLGDLGRLEEALAAYVEATHICGGLVSFRSSYRTLLAVSMQNMSRMVAALGNQEHALGYIQAAVATLRALQNKRYGWRPWWAALLGIGPIFGGRPPPADAFLPILAGALATQSRQLAEMGRREEALAASTEAVATYRWLAWWFSAARPHAFTANLAGALNSHSANLAKLGSGHEALAASTEAVATYRWLAAARPDEFTDDLALELNNQSVRLSEVGRWEEALGTSTEAVATDRWLAWSFSAARPDAFTAQLATALRNQSYFLAHLGRYEEAMFPATEVLDMYRSLAAHRPEFVPDVARSLVLQGRRHAELGELASAVSAEREAVSIYTRLASTDLACHRDWYDSAIRSLTQHLSGLGRTEQEVADELDCLLPQGGWQRQ